MCLCADRQIFQVDRVHASGTGILRKGCHIPRPGHPPLWLPNSIITDLGTQFTGNAFWDFCDERSIVVKYVSVAHPRANGQVERTNGMILDALKKRMYRENDKAPGRWLKELPAVVWGLRTQPSRNTSVSPYFMVYGVEAVLLADIAFRSAWVENFDEDKANEARELEVNSAKEKRLDSCIRTAKYLAVLRRYYNKNVKRAVLHGQGPGPKVEDESGWCPQTRNSMGRTLHDQGSHTTNVLQVSSPRRYGRTQFMAHQ